MRFSLTTLLILFLCTCGSAQVTPAEALEGMGRGINLGNTLEPPQEGGWNNGPAQESYFDRYVEAGFTNVRIPVRWDEHTSRSAPYAINEAWMDRVEQVVDWALERDLWVTLNGHHEDWLKNGYANPNLRARYDSIWVQIIDRFQDKDEKLLYEIINEPNGMSVAQVDDLNARILGIIREVEPTRIVIYGGNVYANSAELFAAAIPQDDYIMGYFHSYDPWPFAGQAQRGWGSVADYENMERQLGGAAAWADVNNVAVTISEFGAIHENDYNDRMRYYAAYVDAVQRHGFSWSVWDDGGMFGVLNRGAGTWPPEKDILVHYYPDSPHRVDVQVENEAGSTGPVAKVTWENRRQDNDAIIMERSVNGGPFEQVATLASDAELYEDATVEIGRSYAYRMYTHRPDGTLLHGYPQRASITSNVQLPFNGTPLAIPGTIDTKDYDLGGQGLAYNDQEDSNIPGGFRPAEGVDLEPNGKGGFHIGYVNQGEWVEYTVDVATAGTYEVTASVASEQSGGAFTVGFPDDNSISFPNISATGGWTTHTTIASQGTLTLAAGEQVFRISITGAAPVNIDELTFTLQSTSTTEVVAGHGTDLYPNPVGAELRFTLPKGQGGQVDASGTVSVYNAAGERVREVQAAGNTLDIDVADLSAGSYVLRYVTDARTTVYRFVKQK
ncbi:cellulase family glycosylhydrolase [Lewinella sp. 4G2]|uniref:cellulase family glycosylhydrolase n=1 Tax=Lewinella sp. 4G2 TaxID=1803372 RepID=UPI0008340F9C|nr:cellulase family glycosylhydrolase [Lewinella sp. 4G2]